MINRKIAALVALMLVNFTCVHAAEPGNTSAVSTNEQAHIQSKQMPAEAKLRLAQRVQNRHSQQAVAQSTVQSAELKKTLPVNKKIATGNINKGTKAPVKFGTTAVKPAPAKRSNLETRLVHADGTLVSEAEKVKLNKGKKNKHSDIEERIFYLDVMLPKDYKEISIKGTAVLSKTAAVNYVRQNNPNVKLACSIDKLVDFYWQEAEREGIRGDLALCQAITETGFFKYGGDVVHNQNNFCGLGTTGGGVRGASFKTPQLGVRAHIQHLLAYSRKEKPKTSIIDPRYDLAHNLRVSKGLIDKWSGLNGTWAMGAEYCEKIMYHYARMGKAQNNNTSYVPKNGKKPTMRERVAKYRKK